MNDETDAQMSKKEHYLVSRLKKLRPIFDAFFSRTETVKHALPQMDVSIANIIRDARVIEAGLGHIREGYFDSQELSDEFAHIVTFALALPDTLEGDGGFWGYALNLVNLGTLKDGAEYCEIEQLENFIWAFNEVLAVKRDIRDRAKEE